MYVRQTTKGDLPSFMCTTASRLTTILHFMPISFSAYVHLTRGAYTYYTLVAEAFHTCHNKYRQGKGWVRQPLEWRHQTLSRLSLPPPLSHLPLSLLPYFRTFALFTVLPLLAIARPLQSRLELQEELVRERLRSLFSWAHLVENKRDKL